MSVTFLNRSSEFYDCFCTRPAPAPSDWCGPGEREGGGGCLGMDLLAVHHGLLLHPPDPLRSGRSLPDPFLPQNTGGLSPQQTTYCANFAAGLSVKKILAGLRVCFSEHFCRLTLPLLSLTCLAAGLGTPPSFVLKKNPGCCCSFTRFDSLASLDVPVTPVGFGGSAADSATRGPKKVLSDACSKQETVLQPSTPKL